MRETVQRRGSTPLQHVSSSYDMPTSASMSFAAIDGVLSEKSINARVRILGVWAAQGRAAMTITIEVFERTLEARPRRALAPRATFVPVTREGRGKPDHRIIEWSMSRVDSNSAGGRRVVRGERRERYRFAAPAAR